MCVRVEGSASVLCIFIMWPVTFACICMRVMHVHYGCASVSVHVREVGAAECYHKLVGHSSAAKPKKQVVVSQSPPGKPVAVVLALQHQCQDRKLTVALGENVSESSEENAPETRIRGAKSPSEERRGKEIKNSCQGLHKRSLFRSTS